MTEPITPIIDIIGSKYVSVNKGTKFEKDDIITFSFTDGDHVVRDITNSNFVGMINKVEDRYITISFSRETIQNGEIKYLKVDSQMVVKSNGWAKISSIVESGVTEMDLPLCDVVNHPQSIIIKNIIERVK